MVEILRNTVLKLTTFILIIMFMFPITTYAAGQSWSQVVDEIDSTLNEALNIYTTGQVEDAKNLVNDAYFGPYEQKQMEKAVKFNISAQRNAIVEEEFRQIRKMMSAGQSKEEVENRMSNLVASLYEDAKQLDGSSESSWGVFLSSFLIIVREGFEAMLILSAIIAYLIKSGNPGKVKTIYQSALAALAASVLTAIAIKYVFKISGASQEILEGVTMLVAVAVLFSVSFWLISKVEAEKWKNYIEGKIKTSLTTGNTLSLWLATFLAVYREGAETVLFYQALVTGQPDGLGMIGLGFVMGSVSLVGIFIVVTYGSIKLPLKPFFIGTSVLMYYLAFVFAGEGIRELQAGNLVGSTAIEGIPVMGFLGVYPTMETLALQIVLLAAAVIGFGYQLINSSKQKANMNNTQF